MSATVALTIATSQATAQASARPTPTIPRYAATARDTIWLGAPRATVAMYAETPADTMVRLPLLTSEDADGVVVYLDAAGMIRRIGFVYFESRGITALLEQHQRDFGPASEYSSAPVPEGIRESWSWHDARTHMMFTRFTPAQQGTGAVLVLTSLVP